MASPSPSAHLISRSLCVSSRKISFAGTRYELEFTSLKATNWSLLEMIFSHTHRPKWFFAAASQKMRLSDLLDSFGGKEREYYRFFPMPDLERHLESCLKSGVGDDAKDLYGSQPTATKLVWRISHSKITGGDKTREENSETLATLALKKNDTNERVAAFNEQMGCVPVLSIITGSVWYTLYMGTVPIYELRVLCPVSDVARLSPDTDSQLLLIPPIAFVSHNRRLKDDFSTELDECENNSGGGSLFREFGGHAQYHRLGAKPPPANPSASSSILLYAADENSDTPVMGPSVIRCKLAVDTIPSPLIITNRDGERVRELRKMCLENRIIRPKPGSERFYVYVPLPFEFQHDSVSQWRHISHRVNTALSSSRDGTKQLLYGGSTLEKINSIMCVEFRGMDESLAGFSCPVAVHAKVLRLRAPGVEKMLASPLQNLCPLIYHHTLDGGAALAVYQQTGRWKEEGKTSAGETLPHWLFPPCRPSTSAFERTKELKGELAEADALIRDKHMSEMFESLLSLKGGGSDKAGEGDGEGEGGGSGGRGIPSPYFSDVFSTPVQNIFTLYEAFTPEARKVIPRVLSIKLQDCLVDRIHMCGDTKRETSVRRVLQEDLVATAENLRRAFVGGGRRGSPAELECSFFLSRHPCLDLDPTEDPTVGDLPCFGVTAKWTLGTKVRIEVQFLWYSVVLLDRLDQTSINKQKVVTDFWPKFEMRVTGLDGNSWGKTNNNNNNNSGAFFPVPSADYCGSNTSWLDTLLNDSMLPNRLEDLRAGVIQKESEVLKLTPDTLVPPSNPVMQLRTREPLDKTTTDSGLYTMKDMGRVQWSVWNMLSESFDYTHQPSEENLRTGCYFGETVTTSDTADGSSVGITLGRGIPFLAACIVLFTMLPTKEISRRNDFFGRLEQYYPFTIPPRQGTKERPDERVRRVIGDLKNAYVKNLISKNPETKLQQDFADYYSSLGLYRNDLTAVGRAALQFLSDFQLSVALRDETTSQSCLFYPDHDSNPEPEKEPTPLQLIRTVGNQFVLKISTHPGTSTAQGVESTDLKLHWSARMFTKEFATNLLSVKYGNNSAILTAQIKQETKTTNLPFRADVKDSVNPESRAALFLNSGSSPSAVGNLSETTNDVVVISVLPDGAESDDSYLSINVRSLVSLSGDSERYWYRVFKLEKGGEVKYTGPFTTYNTRHGKFVYQVDFSTNN